MCHKPLICQFNVYSTFQPHFLSFLLIRRLINKANRFSTPSHWPDCLAAWKFVKLMEVTVSNDPREAKVPGHVVLVRDGLVPLFYTFGIITQLSTGSQIKLNPSSSFSGSHHSFSFLCPSLTLNLFFPICSSS